MNFYRTFSPHLAEVHFKFEPIVIRINSFTEETAKEFHELMIAAQNSGQPIIPVIVDSYGGDPYALISMMSCIRNSPIPVATIVVGKAMSCGAFLAAFGTPGYRFCDPMATYMIHEVSANSDYAKNEELKASVRQIDMLNSTLFNELNEASGQPNNYFQNLLHKVKNADHYMTANEARDENLVDHLHVPDFDMSVDVNFKFNGIRL
jgi:ATP-dependent Clp protease protease subunit